MTKIPEALAHGRAPAAFAVKATSRGRALSDRRLHLPEHSWSNDPERRTAAGIPEMVQFATKPRLAAEMIEAALDAGITASWVTGDEAYGQDPQLRAALQARGIGYVLAVACSTRVRINQGRTPARADALAGRLPATVWHRQSAGYGAKGPRYYDWAWIHIDTGSHRHLLIRRNRSTGELAFYLCWSPVEVTLSELVRVAGAAGASRSASRPPRTRSDSTTTRSATGPHGTGTSRLPCSPWPS
ncbi:transposase [Streptomyces sp. NPDC039016]|uniref:IS701 family transposase n=1 Tax=Streptomyces sp. NPDC039016 TaxID=3154330 RepID=UPI0033CF3A48